jgi:glycine/D-amino acid oxidase-like deaminating enzyme
MVLATGAWLGWATAMLDVDLPVHARINQVSVMERCAPLVRVIVGHALGLLTLKQSQNGTVLIGGGWQGIGDTDTGRTRVDAPNLVGNLRLARYAIPGLEMTRLLRTWHGFEAHVPDFMPVAGRLPNHAEAYALGCVRGGWTIGPYIGQLLADQILGRVPEMPLFPVDRFGPAAVQPSAG